MEEEQQTTCPKCGSELVGGRSHREDGRECVLYSCKKCGEQCIVAGQLMKTNGKWVRVR